MGGGGAAAASLAAWRAARSWLTSRSWMPFCTPKPFTSAWSLARSAAKAVSSSLRESRSAVRLCTRSRA
eukprot:5209079-Lingulodinium_polyedra.AAC.1